MDLYRIFFFLLDAANAPAAKPGVKRALPLTEKSPTNVTGLSALKKPKDEPQ